MTHRKEFTVYFDAVLYADKECDEASRDSPAQLISSRETPPDSPPEPKHFDNASTSRQTG